MEIGIFLNMLGYGAVLPFEIIYLRDGRGFSLGVVGLVVGTITGLAVVNAPVAGPLIDRFGARSVTAGAGVALAAGYAGLAFADRPAGFSWWIGLTTAPILGAPLLGLSATGTFLGTTAIAFAAGASILTLGRRLPATTRLTPRPDKPH
ncbi:MAG TPA: MFS transporter [Streptosporangiaceae bacterium]|nr:MFS transporter [Streptosporangiaceae bacterium]